MRPPHRILNRNQVHRLAAEHLQEHLKFKDYKKKTSAQMLWSLLLAAAARITSLSDVCQRLDNVPSDETARKALLATLPDYAALQQQLNAALAGHLPQALRKHLQILAIDLTLIPYHGRPFRELDEVYRSQAKSGTSHFHAYAMRAITIIDGLSIEIIDGISSIRRVLRVPVASFSCLFSLLQTAAALQPHDARGDPHQRRIQGTSQPRRRHRSIAA